MEQGFFHLIDPHLFRMTLFRWLDIIGITLWVGAVGFRLLVFLPSLLALPPTQKERLQKEESVHTEPVLSGLLIYLLILHLITWVHQAGMMSGEPLSDILPILPVVLTQTHFGLIWIIKLFLIGILLALIRFRFKLRDPLLLGLGLSLCLTGSLTGHAIHRGPIRFLVFSDWFHYVAVSLWAGGLLPLRRMARKSAVLLDPPRLASFLTAMISAFSQWATLSVLLIVMTGTFNAFVYLQGKSIFTATYGYVLSIKLILAFTAFGLGGFSRFYILPSLRKIRDSARGEASDLERRFFHAVAIEMGVVVAALILAALLTQTPPPPPLTPG